jgi:phage terminase small subunit
VKDTLKKATRAWVEQMKADYVLDEHHELMLEAAGQLWDRYEEARDIISRDGILVTSPTGVLKPHPLIATERNAVREFAALIKQLKLDGDDRETLPVPGVRSHRGLRAV